MKILLHGATGGSNYGDFLFADLFYQKVQEYNKEGENFFFEFSRFGFSSYFRKELGYTHHQTIKDLKEAELLILFSGGYFGERNNTLKERVFRFMRYVPISTWFILRKKPIIISGVGGGPLSNPILRKSMTFIMKNASLVTVRDEETKNYYSKYGVNEDNLVVTTDTAQVITPEMISPLEKSTQNDLNRIFHNKKIIFLHIYGQEKTDRDILEKIVPPLNEFLEQNSNYGVVIGCDWESKLNLEEHAISRAINSDTKYYYNFSTPGQFSALLNAIDFIITPKLHVGIIGSTFSKSVISFPMHKEKTLRYYNQIGEAERCLPLDEVNYQTILTAMNKFHNQEINLSNNIKNLAKFNLEMLEEKISALKDN